MNASGAVDRKRIAALFIGYGNSGLPFHCRNVPVESFLQAYLIEHDRMQRLREAAHAVKRRLSNLADFPQIDAQAGLFGNAISRAAQHQSDCRENLSELIMQFA